jgi:hypothetical protein
MPDTLHAAQAIQVGDSVAYRFITRTDTLDARGKVIGLFRTKDGRTIADVEWNRLWPPKRLDVQRLSKVK